jgi:hypothetical protein
VKEIVLAKLGDADIRPPALRLHDIGIEPAKPLGQFALLGGRKPARQIQMKIRHNFFSSYWRSPRKIFAGCAGSRDLHDDSIIYMMIVL